MRNFPMDPNIRVNSNRAPKMAKESSNGLMEKSIKANGRMEKNMAAEYGKVARDKATQDNGKTDKQKDLVYTYPKGAIDMKVSLKTLINTDMAPNATKTDKLMSANTEKIAPMVKDNISGQTETITKVNL